jgi:outer membrane protein assembly factor BamB
VLLVGNVLLIQSERGPVALVDASPSGLHELTALPALSSKTWNVPAIAGEYLLVRNDLEAVCYRLPVREGK